MQLDRCKSCGGELNRVGNYYVCRFCGNKWMIDADNDVHVIDRANAWSALRDCDFERAVELFESIIYKEPENHEAYWGRALASAGIMYVTDLDEHKKVPTCNSISEESFILSKDVQKAISLAPRDIADTYKKQAEYIESIRVEWLKKASKEKPYDIFICFKDSDREHNIERTDDSYDAHALYNDLTREGYRVFFSRVSLEGKTSEHYEPYIYNALKTAKVMIVFGEKAEYFKAVWVKNEWSRFAKMISRGEKEKNSLVVVYKNLNPGNLPASLSSRQCLNAGDFRFFETLKHHIEKIVNPQKDEPKQMETPVVSAPVASAKKKKWVIIAAIAFVLALSITLGAVLPNLFRGDLGADETRKETALENENEGSEEKSENIKDTPNTEKESSPSEDSDQKESVSSVENTEYDISVSFDDAKLPSSTVLTVDKLTEGDSYEKTEEALAELTERFYAYDMELSIYGTHMEPDGKVTVTLPLPADIPADQAVVYYVSDDGVATELNSTVADGKISFETDHFSIYVVAQRKLPRSTIIFNANGGNGLMENAEVYSSQITTLPDNRYTRLGYHIAGWAHTPNGEIVALDKANYQVGDNPVYNLYAIWEPDTNTVTFDAKGGECDIEELTVIFDAEYTLPTPEWAGHTFSGWFNGENKVESGIWNGVENITLSAKWDAIIYDITYDLDGGEADNVNNYNTDDGATISDPTKTGYTFLGWTCDGQSEPQKNVTVPAGTIGDLMFVAHWQANTYAITFDANGGECSDNEMDVTFDGDVILPVPEMEGHEFVGWFLDGNIIDVSVWNIAKDVTLVAKWDIITYDITYNLDGGTASNINSYDTENGATIADPTKTGYSFLGWTYTGQTKYEKNVVIVPGTVGDIEFTAHWQANKYTITLDANGGECEKTKLEVTYDAEYTLPEPEWAGHTFGGWFNGNAQVTSGTWKGTTNVALTAKWDIITYDITYNLDGGTASNVNSYDTENGATIADPTKTGYTFLGWTYTGQSEYEKNVVINPGTIGDIEFVAHWQANKYTITLNANGGECEKTKLEVTYDSEYTLPEPEWAGHTYGGWFNGNAQVTSGTWKGTTDIALTAKWDIIKYTVTYDLDGGTNGAENPAEYTVDDSFSLAEPVRTGYSFLGWTYEGQTTPIKSVRVEKGTIGNKTYTANWQANTYIVTLDADGGTVSQGSVNATYDSYCTLPTPERDGYEFDGWYNGSKQYTSGTWKTDSNIVLVAHWNVNSYTLTYDKVAFETNEITVTYNYGYSGATSTSVILTNTQKLEYPNNPTRNGYVFSGWYTDSSCTSKYNFCGSITEDMTLYAGWTTCTVTNNSTYAWSSSNGVLTSTNKGNSSSSVYKITATVPVTVTFQYKTSSESGYDKLTIAKGSTQIKTCSGSTSYESCSVVLNAGEYLTFTYSKDGSQSSGSDCAYIKDLTCTSNVSYTSTATANCNDVAGLIYDAMSNCVINVDFDSYVTLIEPTRVGYTFDGWYNGGNELESGYWKIAGNITLQARWIKNQYTVSFDVNGGDSVCPDQTVTFDDNYTIPTPKKTGYVFDGWYYNDVHYPGETKWLTPENITLVAKWTPRNDITYVVNHYQQNANDNGYTNALTQTLTGTADSTITPAVQNYTHFVAPPTQTVTVAVDGSLIVDYYYDRVTYDLTYVTNGGEAIEKQTYKYGQTLVISTPTRAGYTFGGWFTDKTLATPYSATATLNEDITIYAYWTEENKPTDFTYSGTDEITISGYSGTSTTMWMPAYIGGVPVTTIPHSAFRNKTDIVNVHIPDTITSLGWGIFEGCTAIEEITTPFVGAATTGHNDAYYVLDSMFAYKSNSPSTTNTHVPASVKKVTITKQTELPYRAFYGCKYIEEINIPDNVTSIGSAAFYGCSALLRLNSTIDGVFNIPEGVTEIKQYTFKDCDEMTKVTIPEGVTSIAAYAFNSCAQLVDVEFDTECKLETIGDYAFADCVSIPELQLPTTVTSIGNYALSGCISIAKINSETDGELNLPVSVKTIDNYAFEGLAGITKVNVPDSVTTMGYGIFRDCTSIEEMTIPFIPTFSLDHLFYGGENNSNSHVPTSLKKVTISNQTAIKNYSFRNCKYIEEINIPENVTSIGSSAFSGCSALLRLNSTIDGVFNIPEGVTEIKQYTFKDCDEMTKVTIPEGVTSIAAYAFNSCAQLVDVEFDTECKLETIGDYAFADCVSIPELQLPTTVTSIGNYALSGCISLAKINSDVEGEMILPNKVTTIGQYAFQNLALITKVVVPDSVTSIGLGAFKGCNAIEDLTIPFVGETLKTKEDTYQYPLGYIFGTVSYEGATGVTQYFVGDQAGRLTTVTYYIPDSLRKVTVLNGNISSGAFDDCGYLTEITIPTDTAYIGAYAFYNCIALKRLNSTIDGEFNIPNSVTAINKYAFDNCDEMLKVIIPAGVTSVGSYAFNSCAQLADVMFADGCVLETIGKYAFADCISISDIQLPENVTSIGDYAFSGCISILKINSDVECEMVLPNSVKTIGEYAFQNLSSITKVVVPDTVTSIGLGAFKGCNAIEDIILPFVGTAQTTTSGYSSVLGYIFGYTSSSSSGTTRQYYTSSSSYYYYIPASLNTVTISDQTIIPSYAFNGCSMIVTINLPTTATPLASTAIKNCPAAINYNITPTLSYWNGTSISASLLGSGTEEDPYQINTATDLAYLASSVNAGESYEGKYFILNVDINLNSNSWTPIGTKTAPFAGVFDGNGKEIRQLSVTLDTAYAGLFGYVSGTVKNLGVVSGTVAPKSTVASTYVGSLVGYLTGTIDNCYSMASVSVSITNIVYAGGLVGLVDASAAVRDSYASGVVNATSSNGFAYAGGLVGSNKGTIERSLAFGNVTAKGSSESTSRNGGFAGTNSGTLTECYRSEKQTLTKYTTADAAYCTDGTVASVDNMIAFAKANWDNDVWSFELNYPEYK